MNKEFIVFDIEADNLLENVTKIHCFCYTNITTGESGSISNTSMIKDFLDENKNAYFIGHNIILYDFPVMEKLYKMDFSHIKKIDTLALSWTLSPERVKHGLEGYGEEYGIQKPKIEDWNSQSLKDYIYRCTEDVKINVKVWESQLWYLQKLYIDDEVNMYRYLHYLTFKLECVKEHVELGVKLDVKLCEDSLKELEALKEQKIEILKAAMPKKPIKAKKSVPKAMYKADGKLSKRGEEWLELLKNEGLPLTHTEDVEVITGWEEPNPNSHVQIKEWLFSLGWEPGWYKYTKIEGSREMKKIPQVKAKEEEGEICESIHLLYDKEPQLEELAGYSIISHRITIFKGFLENQKNGRICQELGGLTNTLRLQHRNIVNLPASSKKHSENIRAALIPDDGYLMIGCDLSGIEDNTKRHYIYQYDPEYVNQMSIPGYDPHLELGMLAEFLSQEQVDFYKDFDKKKSNGDFLSKEDKEKFKEIKDIRHKSKTANFAATYKVGAATLSRNSGLELKKAKKLLDIYWQRNKAILDVEESLQIRMVGAQKWLFNPISKFWYSLRADKDKFSTLNQG